MYAATSSSCVSAPLGKIPTLLGDGFVACPAGTYRNSTNMTACAACAPGQYSSTAGAVSCTPCPKGLYGATSGGTACSSCTGMLVTTESGSSSCRTCAAGLRPIAKNTLCASCAVNEYLVPPVTCVACADGSVSAAGATTCTRCVGLNVSTPAGVCGACPAGSYAAGQPIASCRWCTNPAAYIPVAGLSLKHHCSCCSRALTRSMSRRHISVRLPAVHTPPATHHVERQRRVSAAYPQTYPLWAIC